MVLLMGFLVLVGLIIPVADLCPAFPFPTTRVGPTFRPDSGISLGIGMGGYIGGRSLEKIAGQLLPKR